MLDLIASALISSAASPQRSEEIGRFCSYVVGVPYSSDNITQEEWERFTYCYEHIE